jgi:Subtilase family/Fibronectin type-III domain/Peptidase inhibitor I9/PA domain
MRLLSGSRRAASLVAVGATLVLTGTGLAAASTPQHQGQDGRAAFAASAREVRAAGQFRTGNYIVLLKQAPAATYQGGITGVPATARNGAFNPDATDVRPYRGYLTRQQSTVARQYSVSVRERYTVAINGFSAHLSATQARGLAKDPRVLAVSRDRLLHTDSVPTVGPHATSEFLGLTHHGQPVHGWNPKTAGKGVVVGVIDSGIWPENPAFAGNRLKHRKHVTRQHPGPIFVGHSHDTAFRKGDGHAFRGTCQPGQRFKANTCNSKVISARYFDAGFLQTTPRNQWSPAEFKSARDGVGHGSHTSSTAAGDYGVKAKLFHQGVGRITGIAPAAKIATYKALWSTAADPTEASGATSDIVAAIDKAVADGVDVINYSVGPAGGDNDIIDPVAVAFLNAASAGVFVAAAGGNDGPAPATVSNVSPWVTTAAASTWQNPDGTVVLGNGKKILGVSHTADGTSGRLVYANSVRRKKTGSDGASAAECGLGTLSRAKAHGTIILCDRGTNLFVNKLAEVKRVHAAGVIIGDVDQPDVVPLSSRLPSVSVHKAGRATILSYIRRKGAAHARLVAGNATGHKSAPVPQVADFSSRGPSQTNADVLKPDVAAPGVSVLAAVAPPSNGGLHFDFYDGTSMATPHIAGLAAWQLGKRPKLHPDVLRSMFMTTAHDTVTPNGHKNKDAFVQGAGQVSPLRLGDPGLVFPAGLHDWLAWLEGQGINTGSGINGIQGYNLNEPSILVSSLVSSVTVTREVKNVSGHRETYRASYSGGRHLRVSFGKSGSFHKHVKFAVGAGKKRILKIRILSHGGLSSFASGFLSLVSKKHAVRIPVVARPLALSVTGSVEGSNTSGNVHITGKAGSSGTLSATVQGLVGSTPATGTVQGDGGSLANADVTSFTVPAGTRVSRIDLDAGTGSNDLDLYLFANDGSPFDPTTDPLVAVSASGSASERLLGRIPVGDYWVVVDGFDVDSGGGDYTLTTWNVSNSDNGNLSLAPASQPVSKGNTISITGSYSGLNASRVYFGQVTSTLGSQSGTTFVTIRP